MRSKQYWIYPASTLIVLILSNVVMAAGSGMPWEGPLQDTLDSITGPVVRFGAIVAIIVTAIGMAFSDGGGAFLRRMVSLLFGISIAFAAVTWGLDFFGFSGGASF